MLKRSFNFLSSLNEYVNAGIDAVKITEQPITPHQLTSNSEALPAVPNSSLVPSIAKCERFQQIDNHSYVVDESSNSNCTPVLADAAQNNGESTNSIEKVQPQNVPIETIDSFKLDFPSEQNVSATTISSFQDDQNVHDSKTNLMDSSENVSIDETTEMNESIEQTSSSETDDDDDDDSDSLTCDNERTSDPEFDSKIVDDSTELRTGNGSIEMRTELSSVVPPTSMSLEITATQDIDTALPETLNGSEESSESSELNEIVAEVKIENEAPEMSNVDAHDDDRMAECVKIHKNIHPVEMAVTNHTLPVDAAGLQSQDRFIKPISFETAATMDDVSDTELESYLQELEDLEENSAEKPKIESDLNKAEDVELYASDGIYNVNQTFEHASEIIAQIASRDDRNADSFSQASTVEFGEANPTNEQLSNVTSDQIIESVQSVDLDVDAVSNNEVSDDGTQHQVLDNQADDREAELPSDLDNHTECSECEFDQLASGGATAAATAVAKRPNSLNLQNCNSPLIESQQTQSNFPNDDNAGNTPAACGQFLSSSISSDDSNITADTNQIVSAFHSNLMSSLSVAD